MARSEGLCNPAPGSAGYDHTGSGKVAGKPSSASTITSAPANKPPQVTGENMNLSNMGGMEHVMTSPSKGDHGPQKGSSAKLGHGSITKGPPGPGVARNLNEV